jgi:hypothetical protein
MTSSSALVLQPSRRRASLYVLGCLGFVAAGTWIAYTGEELTPAFGWLAVVFFGLCAIVFLVNALPNSSCLTLTHEGFVVRSLFRSQPLVRWSEVERFEVGSLGGRSRMVVFYFAASFKRKLTGDAAGGKIMRLAQRIGGHEGALPDTYGLSAEDLATLMNEWRDRTVSPRI